MVSSIIRKEIISPQAPILEIIDLDAAYGSTKVLHQDQYNCSLGSLWLLGSGSGKSTAARVITGLLPQISGEVKFEGVDLPPNSKIDQRTKAQDSNDISDG